jgi:integral membrane protein
MANSLFRLRIIAFIEGVSYIVLLFIAMPLKYWASMPAAVRIVGMVHGVLFVLFLICMLEVMFRYKLSILRSALIFVSSFVPFGTFVLDAKLLKKLEEK